MAKYVRIDWPASQDWMDCEEVHLCDDMSVFVPEELFNAKKEGK